MDLASLFPHRIILIGRGDDGAGIQHGDYRFVLQGPAPLKTLGLQNELILSLEFNDELMRLIVRSRAAELLAIDNVHKKIMTQISKDAIKTFGEKYLALLIQSGVVIYAGHKTEVNKLQTNRSLSTLGDIIEHVKARCWTAYLLNNIPVILF